MTVQQAQTALRAARYSDSGIHDTQQSYIGAVVDRWQSQYGVRATLSDPVPHHLVWRKGEEEVTVTFIALPSGLQVNAVTYWAKDGAPISQNAFTSGVLAKYGEPLNEDSSDLRWCTVKAPECEDVRDAAFPTLAA